MAGIGGIIYPDAFQVHHNLIIPMLGAIKHRGPDTEDTFIFRDMQLGICGNPLVNRHHRIIVGLDGTIYNRKELSKFLEAEGCSAKNDSSSELIAAAYELWNTAFLEKIDGEFALFILDQKAQRLILARDRVGKKPLYWYHDNQYFLFSSELKGIMASGIVPQAPAMDALATYLYFGYIPQDMSPIKGVNKLLPGYYLNLNANQSKAIIPYWSYSSQFLYKPKGSSEEISQHLDLIMQKSVSERIPERQPFSCMLSGGLGSASVAYYLQKLAPKERLCALTVGFQQDNDADSHAAQLAASSLGVKQDLDTILPNQLLEDMIPIAWFLDEPLGDPNVIATWKLAKLAKPYRVLFSGMGCDEFLAGHNRYTAADQEKNINEKIMRFILPFIKPILLPLLNRIYKPGAYSLMRQMHTNSRQYDYLSQNAIFKEADLRKASPILSDLFEPIVFLQKFHKLPQIPSTVASFLYFDVKTRLPDCFIMQFDRLTAAHEVDWRAPYLAKIVMEYLAGAMTEIMELESQKTSAILKLILKDIFPPEFLFRPKKTRRQFLSSWSEKSGLDKLFRRLPKGSLVEAGLISPQWLEQRVSSPQQIRESFRHLWSILALEIWYRLFINHPITTQPPNINVAEFLYE